AQAILVMTSKRFGCVGIVDSHGRLIGIVTDGDLRRHMAPDLLSRRVGSIMTANPKTMRPEALAGGAPAGMNTTQRTGQSLFVVDGGRPVGIVHVHDLLRAGVG